MPLFAIIVFYKFENLEEIKMPFDGLTISVLTEELNHQLVGARIDKIHQPEKDEILITIRHPQKGGYRLLISANPRWSRMHLTDSKKENPSQPPAFCMLLRKYLEGGKIMAFTQPGLERAVTISIQALDEFRDWKQRYLICEFTGRHSNILLVNPETNTIWDAIKKYGGDPNAYREVLPGKGYIQPPPQDKLDPLTADYDTWVNAVWTKYDQTMATALFSCCTGISPFTSRQIPLLAGIDPDMPVEQSGELELSRVFTMLKSLLESPAINPTVWYKKNTPVDFTPFKPVLPPGLISLHPLTMNQACDSFYQAKMSELRLESLKTNLSRRIKTILDKAYKKHYAQAGDLNKAWENEKYKTWGELLTAYAHLIAPGAKSVELNDFYSEEPVKIELLPHRTPIENAQKYFKIYNKSRASQKHLALLMDNNQKEIDYLESVLVAVFQSESPEQVEEIVEELIKEAYIKEYSRKKRTVQEKSRPRHFLSSDGLDILVGRNNRQNDQLTLKQADNHDLWLHTRNIPGTHVIVKLPRTVTSIDQVPDATLEQAAALAAAYSKARQDEKVAVDYTFRANVHKPNGGKPGMVIYDHHWTVIVNPRNAMAPTIT